MIRNNIVLICAYISILGCANQRFSHSFCDNQISTCYAVFHNFLTGVFQYVKTEPSPNSARLIHIIQMSTDESTENNSIELFHRYIRVIQKKIL